jgi:hypothetical protein
MFDDDDQAICPSCGNKVEAGATTCGFCGSSLSGNDPAGVRRPRPEFQRLGPPPSPSPAYAATEGAVGKLE